MVTCSRGSFCNTVLRHLKEWGNKVSTLITCFDGFILKNIVKNNEEIILIIWVNEVFNKNNSDAYFCNVG